MRLAAAAQKTIWSVDRGLPVLGFSTLHPVLSMSLITRRMSLTLVAAFALIAILLSDSLLQSWLRELISKLLFGVRTLDLLSYIAGAAIIVFVALFASYLPARRASRIDPATTLRYE